MNILAVDTSSLVASVCIRSDNKIISEDSVNNKLTHSETIMPLIHTVLNSAEMKIKDIDLFAVANGPGSFTGLRIGIGTVKGLAQGNEKGVIGISTLKALAYNTVLWDGIICPIMDARRDQVYNALYISKDGELQEIKGARAIHINELLEELDKLDEEVIFIGDGIRVYREIIMETLKEKSTFAPVNCRVQRASCLADIAYFEAQKGNTYSYMDLKTIYLRKSQAERQLENS